MKLNLRKIVILIMLFIALFSMYKFVEINITPHYNQYLDCGKIITKSNDEVTIKHDTRTELYLNIQFEKSGFKSIKVSPTTYFKNNKNENICLYLDKKTEFLFILYLFIGGISWVILFFIILLEFLCWLFQCSELSLFFNYD